MKMCFWKKKMDNKEEIIKNNEYFSDSPIKINNTNDELGAEKIIRQIESIIEVVDVSEESYVIGLQGGWGTGKTSILKSINFNDDEYIVFNYSPWIYGNEVNLYEKFFDEFAKYIGSNKSCSNRSIEKDLLEYKFGVLNNLLGSSENNFINLFCIIISIIFSGGFTYKILNIFFTFEIDTTSYIFKVIVFLGLVLLLFWLVLSCRKLYYRFKMYSFYKDTASIEEVKKEISKKLNKINKKIIIVIDDIDRLKSDKISSIFQLVKSTANFNNVIYLLSYDKYIVCEALKKEYQADGYLDKFIQMEISLPKYPMFGLNNIFSEYVNQFLKYVHEKYPDTNYKLSEGEKTEMKHFMLSPKFSEHFKTIRDIKRYVNMLKADFNILHQNHRVNEINILDLIFIEIIKFSDEKFYSWIYETMGYVIFTRLVRGRYIKDIKASIMETINHDYIGWEDLFIYLFSLTTNGVNVSDSSRIGSIYSFDAYFSLMTPYFSNTKFYEILNDIRNGDEQKVLKYINENDGAKDFFRKIEDKINSLDYSIEEEKDLFVKLLIFIINNEKNFNQYDDFLHNLDIDVGRCLFQFLNHLKKSPTEFKMNFVKIFNGCDEYYQLFSFTYNFLNTDYEYLYENEKKYIVDNIKEDHQLISFEVVEDLQNIVHEKFEELRKNNQLHLMWNWCYSIKLAFLLKWLKKDISKYLENNGIVTEFLIKMILETTSSYFKGETSKSDINIYLSHAKNYFNKKQFNRLVKLFDGKNEDKKILENVLKIWKK